MSNLSTSSFMLGSDLGLDKSQSHNRLVSPVSFCIVSCTPVQSPSDQSDSWGEECRMFYLQNEQDGPNLSRTLTESIASLSVSILSNLVIVFSGVLGLFAFIGLYLDLFNHLVLILPEALFLGLFCIMGGQNIETYCHNSITALFCFSCHPGKPESYVSGRRKVLLSYSMY